MIKSKQYALVIRSLDGGSEYKNLFLVFRLFVWHYASSWYSEFSFLSYKISGFTQNIFTEPLLYATPISNAVWNPEKNET